MTAAPMLSELSPDLDQAARYLTVLDEAAESFCFQTFDDDKRRKNKQLASIRNGSLEQWGQSLARMNQQGAGIFVTVNETDGKGRTLDHFQRVRAVWHEQDRADACTDFPLEPHLLIESSPGKFHRYWLVEGLTPEQFAGVMTRMIHQYGSDPNVKDLVRVLRLPGFFHLKDPARPFRVRILQESGRRPYSTTELLAGFPPMEEPQKVQVVMPAAASGNEMTEAQRAETLSLAARAAQHTHEDPTKGRHSQVLWLGRECGRRGLPQAVATTALKAFAKLMRPTDTTGQVQPLDWDAEMKAFQHAHAKGMAEPYPPAARGVPASIPPREPPPAQPSVVVPKIVPLDMARRRKTIEDRINATNDLDVILFEIVPEMLASDLPETAKELLLNVAKTKTKVSKEVMRREAGMGKFPGGEGPNPEIPDWVRELNDVHAVVYLSGKVRILSEKRSPRKPHRPEVTFCNDKDFTLLYLNRRVMMNGELTDWGTAWLRHPDRREFEGVAFEPGLSETSHGIYNLWRNWGITPKPGGPYTRMLALMTDAICAHDDEAFEYVIKWLAHLVQCPADLPGVALVLRSPGNGTGKGTFVELIGHMVGPDHFVEVVQQEHLTGKFVWHLANALLVSVNEALWGGDKRHEGPWKALVTDPTSMVERKGVDAVQVNNYKRIIVSTNNDFPIHRDPDDRRTVILDVSDAYKEDYEFFAELRADMLERGGLHAFFDYLLSIDITNWHPRKIPAALRMKGWDIKIDSGNSMLKWYCECLWQGWMFRQGSHGEDRPLWPTEYLSSGQVPKTLVRDAYEIWGKRRNLPFHAYVEDRQFGKALKKWGVQIGTYSDEYRTPTYRFPDLEKSRGLFGQAIGIPVDAWPGEAG